MVGPAQRASVHGWRHRLSRGRRGGGEREAGEARGRRGGQRARGRRPSKVSPSLSENRGSHGARAPAAAPTERTTTFRKSRSPEGNGAKAAHRVRPRLDRRIAGARLGLGEGRRTGRRGRVARDLENALRQPQTFGQQTPHSPRPPARRAPPAPPARHTRVLSPDQEEIARLARRRPVHVYTRGG